MVTWLASYPRSGNTWVRAMLAMLSDPACRTAADVRTVIPHAADRSYLASVLGSDLGHVSPLILRRAAAHRMSALAVKIHDAWSPVAVPPRDTRAAIYIVRDPRDVALSFAAFTGMPIADVVALLCQPACLRDAMQLPQWLGTWSEHVVSWALRAPFPVIRVRYETLCRRPVRTVGLILGALGLGVSRVRLCAVFRSTRRGALRAIFPREVGTGVVGGWRTALAPILATELVRAHGPVMRWCGYDT